MLNKETINRDIKIDILKVIGLFCIILAHVETGEMVFQIRNFDVPLIVICSGALFYYSAQRSDHSYSGYIKKRLARLLGPSWMFLFIYFTAIFIFCLVTGSYYPYAMNDIVEEYLFRSQYIGLWIIRVFIFMSLIAPFILRVYLKLNNIKYYFVFLILFYFCYELLYLIMTTYNGSVVFKLLKKSLFEIIPYGVLFGLGIVLNVLRSKSILIISAISFVIFVSIFSFFYSKGYPLPTQYYKYPPRAYYLSYALFISFLLYAILRHIKINNELLEKTINFISSSLLWIYLWHWLILFFVDDIMRRYRFIQLYLKDNYLITFLVVLGMSIALTLMQKNIVMMIIRRYSFDIKMKRVLSVIFLN